MKDNHYNRAYQTVLQDEDQRVERNIFELKFKSFLSGEFVNPIARSFETAIYNIGYDLIKEDLGNTPEHYFESSVYIRGNV